MTVKAEIEQEIQKLQAKLAILNRIPEDTFHFGTVVLFVANSNTIHFYYAKTGEETWRSLQIPGNEQSLSEWILNAAESNVGYFEVYALQTPPTPFFASA